MASLIFKSGVNFKAKNFITHKTNKNKVGLNALANRLYILNGRIPLDWLNLSINSFKTKCRIEILKVWSSTIHKNIAPYLPSNPKFCLHTGYSKPQPYRGLTSCLSYLQSEANREQIWLYGWVIACHGLECEYYEGSFLLMTICTDAPNWFLS